MCTILGRCNSKKVELSLQDRFADFPIFRLLSTVFNFFRLLSTFLDANPPNLEGKVEKVDLFRPESPQISGESRKKSKKSKKVEKVKKVEQNREKSGKISYYLFQK